MATPRIIDMVFAKRGRMKNNPDEATRNSAMAVAALHGGVRSRAWRAYMMQFVAQKPLGKPVDDRQLARLLATDGTDGNPDLDRHRAYLVGNGPCGPTTPDLLPMTVNTIDDGIGDDLQGCMTDAEFQAAFDDDPKRQQ
jgi:hypothetical protein